MKKLFSRKKNDESAEQNKAEESAGLSIARLNLITLFVAVIVVLVSGYAAYLQFASQVKARQDDAHIAQARELAALLTGRLQAMGDELARMAQPDAPLLAAIVAENGSYLRQREKQLAGVFPDALRIRYILPSEQNPDDSLVPRLSYACLDLARQAEKGQRPPFEVHLLGSDQQHLDLVRPVYDGDTPVASLMVTLDVATLKAWMDSIKPLKGYAELQQGTGGNAMALFGVGTASLKGRGKGDIAKVGGSGWQVQYWHANGLGMAEAQQAGFMVTFAMAAGLLVAFYIFFNLFLSNLLRSDLKRMVGFIVDSSLGKRFQSYPVKLAECKKVLQEKEMDLSVLSSHASVSEASRHAHDHDEIPELTFASGFGMSVEEVSENGKGDSSADNSKTEK